MLYLFDLDNTLVTTDDLADIREAGVDNKSDTYTNALKGRLGLAQERLIWSAAQLERLREIAPLSVDSENHIGVFTRAPRSYTKTILEICYPSITWDVIVGCEDVAPKFKPHGFGIRLAREHLKTSDVFVIGDNSADIKAAYHAVCWTAWDDTKRGGKFDFETYDLLPDFIFSSVDTFLENMRNPIMQLMALEIDVPNKDDILYDVASNGRTIVLFCPNRRTHKVQVFGKHFSKYAPNRAIRAAHSLSKEIKECKDTKDFPNMWVAVLIRACREQVQYLGKRRPDGRVILTCIPARPARPHRLGNLVNQCERVYRKFFGLDRVVFEPNVFQFKAGVRSNSNDHLSRAERFANIFEHLELCPNVDLSDQDTVIVVDDVVTSGSTLICAERLLSNNGVRMTKLVAMAKNIGKIMPDKWAREELYDTDQ